MHSMRKLILSGTALATASIAGSAVAQNVTLEEIVVTAERRAESLQSVPIPVSALSVEQLENRQIVEGQDLERYVPSLKMTYNITQPTNLSPSLRGSLQQDASLVVAESPFGIYVDDIYVGRLNGNNTRLADVERIEVLRGPQGTLYGRNTLAGAIKFISRQPGDEVWVKGSAAYGNYDQYEILASVGGPISDQFSGSLSATVNGTGGYGTNLATNEEVGQQDNWAGRAKLVYDNDEGFEATAWVSYADSENDAAVLVLGSTPNVPGNQQYGSEDIVPGLNGGFYDTFTADIDYGNPVIENQPRGATEQLIASINMSYDIGENTNLRYIAGYVDTQDYFNTNFGNFNVPGPGIGVPGLAVIGASDIDAQQWTQELLLTGSGMEDRFRYTLGAFYFNEQNKQEFGWYFFAPTSNSLITARTESYSLYGQAEYDITDQLTFTAGLRWIRDEKFFNLDFAFTGPPRIPLPVTTQNETENAWTPRFGIDYQVDTSGDVDSLLLYASGAKGFKGGGFNGINITDTTVAQSPYGAETNWTIEFGAKSEFFGNRLRLNANYFHNRISDLTLNATVLVNGNPTFPVQNAGDVTIQGVEFEGSAVLFDGLTVFAIATFLDGKFRNIDPTSAPANSLTDFGVEAETPQTADYAFTLGFDYRHDFELGGTPAAFNLGFDIYHTDDYVTSATNDFRIDAYNRMNAYVAFEFDNQWEGRFEVQNLEDDRTFITGSRAFGAWIAQPPRTFMFTLSYDM